MSPVSSSVVSAPPTQRRLRASLAGLPPLVARWPGIFFGGTILLVMLGIAVFAGYLTSIDPAALAPAERLKPPSAAHWFGTDGFGRDIYARTLYGARVSLIVGFSVAVLTGVIGTFIGLIAGYFRTMDMILSRVIDALMAIPSILLAIALIALTGGSLGNVILAITLADIPKVVRLVRSVVLSARELLYVEAAIAIGTSVPNILFRHILPNIVSPLIIQATLIGASAILTEAGLGFLGVGTPPEIPSWGNIIAVGRNYFMLSPWMVFFPGMFLVITVLAINFLGDGLRDLLDPRTRRQA